MERIKIVPRNNWQKSVENLGFGFHTTNVPYWKEDAYYSFTMDEVLKLEKATEELWEMCLEAVQYVIDNRLYKKFSIPSKIISVIEKSWNEDAPSIYGRFDFGYDGTNIKMFEFNADTPTSLFEGGIIQWFWLQDFSKDKDQFNSIHEKMIAYWATLKNYLYPGKLYFTCIKHSLEDLTNVEYMRDCAMQAGLETELIYIDDIGHDGINFVDTNDKVIKNIFKLYPWEFMVNEKFIDQVIDTTQMHWIEPAWKMILSNKAILPILWELFPKCPYILECYFEEENTLKDYVRKPILSREGANIQIIKNSKLIEETKGEYGSEGFICQEIFDIPKFDDKTPIIGSWVIGQQSAGMGIREDSNLITGNLSNFVPHLISEEVTKFKFLEKKS